ncbi:MAG: hypothetical protein ACR2PX_02590 [Endozoicomonas sp.]|uniref:hypothetical protein n=1 Tax=Endozoicomonas sp. TaxID=1892382 RepID=UPI003D9BF666
MNILERYLTQEEAIIIVGTGARPICFCENEDSFTWGIGSSFILNYLGSVFIVTAKHVIDNQKADHKHIRVLLPDTKMALPILSGFSPIFYDHENKDDVEDLVFLKVDDSLFCVESGVDLYSWDFIKRSYPASKLTVGDELKVAGFPDTGERYDYDARKISDLLLVRTANLSESELGKDIYTMSGQPSNYSFNGISGAPVFCRRDGWVLFCGIVIRGTAQSGQMHFIGSEIIMSAFKNAGLQKA